MPKGTFHSPTKVPLSHGVSVLGVVQKAKVAQPELPVEERIKGFQEVDLVLPDELMRIEAARCMRCGTLCYSDDHTLDEHMREKLAAEKTVDLLTLSPPK